MNETIENILSRRSVRKFKDTQVEEEKLEQIVKAGEYAATGMGAQSPIMLVVQNKEKREVLRKLNVAAMGRDGDMDPFYNAPTVICVLAQKDQFTHVEDGSLVIGNLMLAAHSLGVDSCWVHRAKEEFETDEGKALLEEAGFDADKYEGVGHCILGYRDCEYPEPKPRKENYVAYLR